MRSASALINGTSGGRAEIVASAVEMLSGRRKKDYAAESAAEALELQGDRFGAAPVEEAGAQEHAAREDDDDDAEPRAEQAVVA